jgi:hypothetical protein
MIRDPKRREPREAKSPSAKRRHRAAQKESNDGFSTAVRCATACQQDIRAASPCKPPHRCQPPFRCPSKRQTRSANDKLATATCQLATLGTTLIYELSATRTRDASSPIRCVPSPVRGANLNTRGTPIHHAKANRVLHARTSRAYLLLPSTFTGRVRKAGRGEWLGTNGYVGLALADSGTAPTIAGLETYHAVSGTA